MNEKVLFVDDEPNVLDGFRRQLRRQFALETATSGEEGLRLVREEGPFAVVVSDMKMPGMDGTRFLIRVREESPDSVRMILSGQAELESTIAAVNEGHIFRFLTKPCPADVLANGVETALAQYRLIIAERELLEKTLSGAVKVLTEVLSLVNPGAFSRASRVQQYAEGVAENLGYPDRWQIRLAAMLSQIGCVALPADTLDKLDAGQELSEEEQQMLAAHPEVAGKLLSSIPRLEKVASMVSSQKQRVDPSSLPEDVQQWDSEILGAQILRAALEFDHLVTKGTARTTALEALEQPPEQMPKPIVKALKQVRTARNQVASRTVKVSELRISMILDEDVMNRTGVRIAPKGQEVTNTLLARLRNFAEGVGIVEPIRVLVPV